MFTSRYFNPRYWASRYWAKIGDNPALSPDLIVYVGSVIKDDLAQQFSETTITDSIYQGSVINDSYIALRYTSSNISNTDVGVSSVIIQDIYLEAII